MRSRHTAQDAASSRAAIERWRRERLIATGFGSELAEELASDRRVDLHAVLELIDRGCPPELAARILAPLDPLPTRHAPL